MSFPSKKSNSKTVKKMRNISSNYFQDFSYCGIGRVDHWWPLAIKNNFFLLSTGHWTRSVENHAIMKKTFWYLLFMVVFLPTFGFTTADAVVKFIISEDQTDSFRWDCVFLPDSGAFFVNYIITAALVGAGLELIRFPEMIFYAFQVVLINSIQFFYVYSLAE